MKRRSHLLWEDRECRRNRSPSANVVPSTVPIKDDKEPKRRPPPATPVTLPEYCVVPHSYDKVSDVDAASIWKSHVATPLSQWTPEQHKHMGVELVNNTYIDDLVPRSYLPPRTWEERPVPEQSPGRNFDFSKPSTETLSNGASIPGHEAFYVRVVDLKCSRDDAMDSLARRKPAPGKAPLRLTHYRRFWTSLDNVAIAWDTSKDDFRPPWALDPMQVDQPVQSQQASTGPDTDANADPSRHPSVSRQQAANMAIGAGPGSGRPPPMTYHAHPPTEPEIKDYYGIRTMDGKSMKPMFRTELVNFFIEPVVTVMGCHYERNHYIGTQLNRAVRLMGCNIRQEVTGMVFRGPQDRALARQNWSEGPVLAVSCRNAFNFNRPMSVEEALQNKDWAQMFRFAGLEASLQRPNHVDEGLKQRLRTLGFVVTNDRPLRLCPWSPLDVIDASHEIGILLMLAQQRARNGNSEQEPKVGEGTWWCDAPRFGGHEHQGAAVGSPLFNDDGTPVEDMIFPDNGSMDHDGIVNPKKAEEEEEQEEEERGRGPIDPEAAMIAVSPTRILSYKRQRRGSGRRQKPIDEEKSQRRKKLEHRWKPPRPMWDPKKAYLPVGKGPEQEFDHVYMVSSTFHHISILRLRIHPAMLAFLTDKKDKSHKPVPRPTASQWGLFVSRTRWFDLFNADDRIEAMRGLWGVMAYMMRDTGTQNPEDKAFARRLAMTGSLAQDAVSR